MTLQESEEFQSRRAKLQAHLESAHTLRSNTNTAGARREQSVVSRRILQLSRLDWTSADVSDVISAVKALTSEEDLIRTLGDHEVWDAFCRKARIEALAALSSKEEVRRQGGKGKGKKAKRSGRSAQTTGGEDDDEADSRIETPTVLPEHIKPAYQVFVPQNNEVSEEVRSAMRKRSIYDILIGNHGQVAGSERAEDMVEDGHPRTQGKGRRQRGRRGTGSADGGPE